MHGVDVQNFVATHPNSALAYLAQRGTTYSNAYAPTPTDSFPGLLALTTDPRTPDFAVKVDLGVIYTGATKIAEHGGFSDDDSHVALLVARSYAPRFGITVTTPVQTAQVAPTILQALNIDPNVLQAVRIEGTQTLPNLIY